MTKIVNKSSSFGLSLSWDIFRTNVVAAAVGDAIGGAASGDTTSTPATGDTTSTPATGDTTSTPATGDTTTTPATGDTTSTPATGDTTTTPATGDTTTTPATGDTSASGGTAARNGFLSIAFTKSSQFSRTSRVSTDDIVAVAEMNVTDEVQIFAPGDPTLDEDPLQRLNFSIYPFRQSCGDRYIKSAKIGSRFLVTVKANLSGKTEEFKKGAKSGLELSLGTFLKVNSNSALSTEQQDVLNSLQFSTKCLVIGKAPSSVCSELNLDDRQNISVVLARLDSASKKFTAAVDDPASMNKHVMLDFETVAYKLPYYKPTLDREGPVFYDNSDRKALVATLGDIYSNLSAKCESAPAFECTLDLTKIEDDIKRCAQQETWEFTGSPCNQGTVDEYRTKYARWGI
ncbi:MAG TPA: hypothetical protein VE954_18310 [Oligoflexus sp.]|uniref:hypothetical protein n=1 Tax=Oligoflexus sp. TaxID=1971216 RepID=UPI002D577A70|nr:hypothetical protein [Oligoflexus sp.]HYX35055.1 hypothetical protein [Oligoflexus sp.]